MTTLLRPPIILASASPRRQELLTNAGIGYEIQAANIPEIAQLGETPETFARRMAREKAHAVHEAFPNRTILAADTVVAIENDILGKPIDAEDAARMLRLLSGREHKVTTGVCLVGDDFEDVRAETTQVHFLPMSDRHIHEYISTSEPMDKAGAYGIQGGAARWISKVEGDYYNVVGLPVDLVLQMMREHNVL